MARLFEDRPGGGLGFSSEASPLAKIGLAIQAFGAGGQGRSPLVMKLQQQELLERKRKTDEMESLFKITNDISKTAAELPDEQRKKYIDRAAEQYPGIDREMIDLASQRPDLFSSLPGFVKTDPLLSRMFLSGDKKATMDFLKSKAGQESWNKASLTQYSGEFQKTLPKMIEWHKQNNSKEYEKIIEDGKVTIPELRRLHEKLPLNYQASPEAFAAVTASENQEVLTNMMGIPVVSDKTSAELQKKELGPKTAESPIGKLRSDLSKGLITQKDFDLAMIKELKKDPSIARDIVYPILSQVLSKGVDSLDNNQWASLELAARQTSGVDIEINRITRDILKDKPEGAAQVPKEIMDKFKSDKSMKGRSLGMKTDQGYEVLDKDGNLIGFYGNK